MLGGHYSFHKKGFVGQFPCRSSSAPADPILALFRVGQLSRLGKSFLMLYDVPNQKRIHETRDLPRCGKNEMFAKLPLHDGMNRHPFVAIRETHPENPRKPEVAQTEFTANTGGAGGYTKFHSINHKAWNELREKGYEAVTFV